MILRLTVALFLLSAIFWLLERWRPGVRATRRPTDTRVDVFGLAREHVPDGLLKQLAYPFQRRSTSRDVQPL